MAYLSRIWPRKCAICGKTATEELKNRFNSSVADYCERHSKKALADFLQQEWRSDVGER